MFYSLVENYLVECWCPNIIAAFISVVVYFFGFVYIRKNYFYPFGNYFANSLLGCQYYGMCLFLVLRLREEKEQVFRKVVCGVCSVMLVVGR